MAFLHPSYFPFCVYEDGGYEVGAGTLWPIGMSLDECMFIYWKAKSFNLIENWSTTGPNSSTVNGTTNTTLTATGDKMSDALCSTYQAISGRSGTFSIYLTNATNPGPYSFQDFVLLDLFVGSPRVIKAGNIYYPQIYFRRDGGYYNYYAWSSWTGDFANPTFAYMASIRLGDMTGDPYQFPIYSDNTGNTYSNTYSNLTVNAQRIAE